MTLEQHLCQSRGGRKVKANLEAFYRKIEEFRLLRYHEEKLKDPTSRRYTQDDLALNGYSNFKNVQSGRRKSPPQIEEIVQLSDYLKLSRLQQNELRAAAGLPLIPLELDPQAKVMLVNQLREYIHTVSHVPGWIIDYNWDILDLNPQLSEVTGISQEYMEKARVGQLPNYNLLKDIIFGLLRSESDRVKKPINNFLLTDKEAWEQLACANLAAFREQHRYATHEQWFVDLCSELRANPLFEQIWNMSSADTNTSRVGFYEISILLTFLEPQRLVRVRSIQAFIGHYIAPYLIQYLPANRETEELYRERGYIA